MIDTTLKVRRFIAEYSEETEELVAEHEFAEFDLCKFKAEFGEVNSEGLMFESYEILEPNISFINKYVSQPICWNFDKSSYFVEAHAI
jgi:hypothetical protein